MDSTPNKYGQHKKKYILRIRRLKKAGVQLTAKDEKEVRMIFQAMPYLEAEERLNSLFKPGIDEDEIHRLAMLVYDDEAHAKRLIQIYTSSQNSN